MIKTPISDKTNLSIDSKGAQYFEDYVYQIGLLLDGKITLQGLTNAQRIEIAIKEFIDGRKENDGKKNG